MAGTILIEPNGVYDDGALVLALGLTFEALARARKEKVLRFTRKGKRTLYMGQWVLEWLADEPHAKTPRQRLRKETKNG
jgi:hypothetical protein